jgi:hypothetical protein
VSNPSIAVNWGLSVIRTYRRSALTTGTAESDTPFGKELTPGRKAT